MPAYQDDYENFYVRVINELNEKSRIKVHERLKDKFCSLILTCKTKLSDYYIRIKSCFTPNRTYLKPFIQYTRTPHRQVVFPEIPKTHHSPFELTDEKISLSSFAYGKMLDDKFKKRFIDSKNHRSRESEFDIEKDAVNYLFKKKINSSLLLKLAVLLHLN